RPPCVRDSTILDPCAPPNVSDCHVASNLQTPGKRRTRGAAKPPLTPGRLFHQRQPADHTSPSPLTPGTETSISRLAAVRATAPAHSTSPRGTAAISTTTTSTV